MATRALPLFDDTDELLPEGFRYERAFLTSTEQRQVADGVATVEFGEVRMHGVVARRRVAQFGWRYGFDARTLEEGAPLPPFLEPVRERVAAFMGVPAPALSEVLVTEYRPGATIGWHRDAPPFDVVAGISLGSSCRFRLRRQTGDGWQRAERVLPPGSLYVLDGPARSEWQHSIPPVTALRYSVTFRTLKTGRGRPVPGGGPGVLDT